jgi:hypothetical protein
LKSENARPRAGHLLYCAPENAANCGATAAGNFNQFEALELTIEFQ